MLQLIFVTVAAPIVVGAVLELFKDWLKNRNQKRH
ncbi:MULTISPECIES: type I toxin-antitoxin system Fst family toxin [unclassified Lactococcus]|nr:MULTISPECIES: type I toxin-antitoxin system Fst family toxin [unclassified Lactococcus]MQW22828.1 type I toxin-antitoxin system Fst family toxin [Lactococcus sp. dk101]TXK44831.1 type I toxin-antitoxin system Fst family toxin [Lactococcus sp. dk310]TXK45743.1 type I toxin-antitoxin system Fst family toxin [Lactococcus sp. dk322]